jgi:hypothetical protein
VNSPIDRVCNVWRNEQFITGSMRDFRQTAADHPVSGHQPLIFYVMIELAACRSS